ncbi:hypothetical protein GCM10009535_13360 [Streptomyces thermocarboxydovorans]|uniref:Integral membrane protein n=1 Tax=Streptomyces thermocarboxydovorans TaxID=59298 RepID=A0ABP3SH35_9ACTN
MYGHGAAPPTRSAATIITLRVLFAGAGILSCGLLAAVPLFRIAILRARTADWVLAWSGLVVSIVLLTVVGSVPESDTRGDVALGLLIFTGAASSVYFLTADIRWHQPHRPGAPVPPSPHATTVQAPGAHAPYGYPQPASPYAATPVPQPPHTPVPQAPHVPHTPGPHTPVPQTPPTPAPPPRPAPARIDQVRAELDELSDYLRRQDGQGGRPAGPESGR